ncbi:hypothetical protein [Shewanella gaetbuli]|uniref:Uncharacterized protein n=1 Tax=Shewanella gaetbuli TaxID=220752 RepID=A0A9X1ZHZ7_9GAMM|nr:hypothetical protein [Shewanella gaetbuli]MCL1141866.1 hypothetical protein [Shewanella gaetbuli]
MDVVRKVPLETYECAVKRFIWKNNNVQTTDIIDLNSIPLVVKPSPLFKDVKLTNRKITAFAEGYGGLGVGFNGGGARVANVGNIQLKGIGVTPYLGDHDNFAHSTGMYCIDEAITESINHLVYAEILPLGVVNMYALAFIGESSHNFDSKKEWTHKLCIGVREVTTRPAHFLRSPFFKPRKDFEPFIDGDVERTRQACLNLGNSYKSHKEFIFLISKFLSNCAKQFAFSRLFRISHGSVTPSNIGVDGRWLDLTNTTFVFDGKNYAASNDTVPFYSEVQSIADTAVEWIYTYSKYNRVSLNSDPLIKYFYEQLDAYTNYFFPQLIGIESESIEFGKLKKPLKILKDYFHIFNHNNGEISVGFPKIKEATDRCTFAIEELFNDFLNNKDSKNYTAEALLTVYNHLTDNTNKSYKKQVIIKTSILKCFKIAYFSSFFYNGQIREQVDKKISQDLNSVQDFIDSFREVAKWIFQKSDISNTIAFSSNSLIIKYEHERDSFSIVSRGNSIITGKNFNEEKVEEIISNLPKKNFIIHDYNFFPSLLKIIRLCNAVNHR